MDSTTPIKGIIFDKDGTLFDYATIWGPIIRKDISYFLRSCNLADQRGAYQQLRAIIGVDDSGYLNPKGIMFNHDELIRGNLKVLGFCLKNHINPFKLIHMYKQALAEAHIGVMDSLSKLDFTAIQSLFKTLHDKGIIIGVVTNDSTISTKICLESMGISDYVKFIRTKDSNCRRKPHPQAIKQYCRAFSLREEEIACIGDTLADMEFAKRGHVGYSVAVLSGSGDKENLEKVADKVYTDITGLFTDIRLFPTQAQRHVDK